MLSYVISVDYYQAVERMVRQPHGGTSCIQDDIGPTKICLLNCCGLKSNTLSDDFEFFINSYDIVCLTDTKLATVDRLEFNDFILHTNCRKGAIRSSGGVAILLKRSMYKFVSILENDDDFSIWFTIDKIIDNQKMLCCVAYVPPENSNYSSLDMFDSIENQYVEFEGLAKFFCLLGDFNARTGSLGDYLDINRHLADHLLLDEYCYNSDEINILESCDIPVNRSSQDNTTNKYGERFLELCKKHWYFYNEW